MPFPYLCLENVLPSHCGWISSRESTGSLQTRSSLNKYLVHNSLQNRVGKQSNYSNAEKWWLNIRGSVPTAPRPFPNQYAPLCSEPVKDLTLQQCPFITEGCPRHSAAFAFCPRNMDLIMRIWHDWSQQSWSHGLFVHLIQKGCIWFCWFSLTINAKWWGIDTIWILSSLHQT